MDKSWFVTVLTIARLLCRRNSEGNSTGPPGLDGHSTSGDHRNLWPRLQMLGEIILSTVAPLEAKSAGFNLEGTWRHCKTLQCCSMTESLFATKTGNFRSVFFMLNRTAVESVQNMDFTVIQIKFLSNEFV